MATQLTTVPWQIATLTARRACVSCSRKTTGFADQGRKIKYAKKKKRRRRRRKKKKKKKKKKKGGGMWKKKITLATDARQTSQTV